MPSDIHMYAQECRKRYLPEASDAAFGNFLHAMHLRWRNHEQRLLDKRALAHERETQDLRRRAQQQKPYNVAKMEEEVRSLRKQLKTRGIAVEKETVEKREQVRPFLLFARPAHLRPCADVRVHCVGVQEQATWQSKEKLLEWSLQTVEELAHQVSTMAGSEGSG